MTVASIGGTSTARSFANGFDDHWHERSEALLATLLHAAALEGAPMSTVLKWVDRHQAGPAQSILDGSGNELAADSLGGHRCNRRRTSRAASGRRRRGCSAPITATLRWRRRPVHSSTSGNGARPPGPSISAHPARHQNVVSPLVVALLEEIRTASKKRAADREANRIQRNAARA